MLSSDSNSHVRFAYPKRFSEVKELFKDAANVVHQQQNGDASYPRIVRIHPGVLLKFGGWELAEEVLCARCARGKLSLPVPRILHHPGSTLHRDTRKWLDLDHFGSPRSSPSVWYYCMEEIRGVSLDKVVDILSQEQQLDIALQLSAILNQMRTLKNKTLGSITGGSYRNLMAVPQPLQPKQAFATVSDFRDYFRDLLVKCGRFEWQIEKIMSCIPLNCPIRFTHGDLVPKNIMVDGSTITGIIDWANAGFYPEFWEYSRMHDPNFMSPGWSNILQVMFPGERRSPEIVAVSEMMTTIMWCLY